MNFINGGYMKNKIEAVLFDMDGLIFDTETVWKEAFFISNEKFGLDLTEEYRQTEMAGKNDIDIRNQMKKEFPNVDIDSYRDFMRNYVTETIKTSHNLLKPYFVELVETLKNLDIKIALTTSSNLNRCKILFENANLDMSNIFDTIVTGENVSKGKPDPEVFLTAINKLNVKPENCVVLEDSILGLQAGFVSGAKPIMVVDLIMPNEEIKKITTGIVYSLKEAKDIILNLNS